MCSAGGDVEYRSRSRGRGRSRSQRAGARSSPVNGSKQGTGPLARNGGWLQRQTLSSPETGGRLAHTVSDGATHSSCSVGRPTQGTGVPGRRRSDSPALAACSALRAVLVRGEAAAQAQCCSLLPAASRRGDHTNTSTRYQHATELRYLGTEGVVILSPPTTARPLPMATQQFDGGVPFAIATTAQKLQLLELPSEVAALLDSPNPPRCAPSSRSADAWTPF